MHLDGLATSSPSVVCHVHIEPPVAKTGLYRTRSEMVFFALSLKLGKSPIWHHGAGYFDCHRRVSCHHRNYRGSASGPKTERPRKASRIEDESCRGMFARYESWP
jgi:hypothetical protein